jgi:hypothetical protein
MLVFFPYFSPNICNSGSGFWGTWQECLEGYCSPFIRYSVFWCITINADLVTEALIRCHCSFKASLWILVLNFWYTLFSQHIRLCIHFLCLLSHQGSNLDSNAKMWRLVADFMNDLGNVQLKPQFSYFALFISLPWHNYFIHVKLDCSVFLLI